MENKDVREGFICPECLKEFDDADQLILHFNVEEKLLRFPIKDLIEKAKQKLLNKSDFPVECTSEATEQSLGIVVSHIQEFKAVRDQQVDKLAVETNNVIIRLDKLMADMPSDLSKRKAFEKKAIPWLNDSEATNCHSCGARFSLIRRKHHCRLCGKILCSFCSRFLTFTQARKMINPAYAVAYQHEVENMSKDSNACKSKSPIHLSSPEELARRLSAASSNISMRGAERFLLTELSKLTGDGSEVSLNSFFNQDGDEHLRICALCSDLLERRDKQMEQRTKTPLIVEIYERQMTLLDEADRLFRSYSEMSRSLEQGESKYELQAAQDLWSKIQTTVAQIKYVASKFSQLASSGKVGPDESTKEPASVVVNRRERDVITNIQQFTLSFLTDVALGLKKLPDSEEYDKLRENYKRTLEAKISLERSTLASAKLKSSASFGTIQSKPLNKNDHQRLSTRPQDVKGWVPLKVNLKSSLSSFASNPFDDADQIEPLEEQIQVIQGYVTQATADGRLEEVDTLQKNLEELKTELSRRQRQDVAETEQATDS